MAGASSPPPADQMSTLAVRSRAWAPVLKSTALFVLPWPLGLALIGALVSGDAERFAMSATALGSFWTAGVLAWRALAAEARYMLGERADLPRVPRKLLSAVFTTGGTALAATAAGHDPSAIAMFAVVGAGGHLAFYGRDLRPRRVSVTPMDGVDVSSVGEQLEQAHQRLRRIEASARAIRVPEFCERLDRIIGIGRRILAEIERDPREATRARRFLHLYLDSTERVTEQFARTHDQVRSQPLEQNFRQLLIEMETGFARQHQKLLEHDVMSLDVDIEVLSARLKREGVPDHVETRS